MLPSLFARLFVADPVDLALTAGVHWVPPIITMAFAVAVTIALVGMIMARAKAVEKRVGDIERSQTDHLIKSNESSASSERYKEQIKALEKEVLHLRAEITAINIRLGEFVVVKVQQATMAGVYDSLNKVREDLAVVMDRTGVERVRNRT